VVMIVSSTSFRFKGTIATDSKNILSILFKHLEAPSRPPWPPPVAAGSTTISSSSPSAAAVSAVKSFLSSSKPYILYVHMR
jgi:hypothetical protein